MPQHMPDDIQPEWVRKGERPCLRCGRRTYRQSKRVGNELIWERAPGRDGAHIFTRGIGGPGTFVICQDCMWRHFHHERKLALAWDEQRARVIEPTDK